MHENADHELADLGPVPEDMRAIVTRILGEQRLTLAYADELLASLSDGAPVPSRPLPTPSIFETESPSKVLEMLESEPPASAPVSTPAQSDPPASEAQSPEREAPASEPPQLSAAARRRAEFQAAMMDSQPAAPLASEPAPSAFERHDSEPVLSFEADTDLSEAPPRPETGHPPERKLEGEATAQAIVAAFADAELDAAIAKRRSSEDDPRITLESAPPDDEYVPSPASDYPRRPARRFERGSRRPDLDKLLEQPLDALDFERSEPLPERAARGSDLPASNPPAVDAADDFEILVDDEILEIAEDEVELVDEDSSS